MAVGNDWTLAQVKALCFMAGANSIFYGDKLLAAGNPDTSSDQASLHRLQIAAQSAVAPA